MAQPLLNQGGIGDPLTLAASGVLMPYITGTPAGTVSLIEVASPVGPNSNMHMLFYNTTCAKVGNSVPLPETVNDIAFFNPVDGSSPTSAVTSGLVAIAGVDVSGAILNVLQNPIHSRVWTFNAVDGRSRYLEPIILDTAEFGVGFGNNANVWSPLRTAATFHAPLQTSTVKTSLTLICPRPTIQGASGAAFGSGAGPFSNTGFPVISPVFQVKVSQELFIRIYNENEIFVRDARVDCDCLVPDLDILSIDSVYGNPALPPTGVGGGNGSYTEIEMNFLVSTLGSFTGYRDTFTVGSGPNHFFGRLSNANRISIQSPVQGVITNAR